PFPMGIGGFLSTFPFTFWGKIRLLAQPFFKTREKGTDESVARFISRRLRPQIEKNFLFPFVFGLHPGDSNKLSISSTFATLAEFEDRGGSISRGAIKAMRSKSKKSYSRRPRRRATLTSFKRGIETLPNAIAENLGDSIELNCSNIVVERTGDSGYSISY